MVRGRVRATTTSHNMALVDPGCALVNFNIGDTFYESKYVELRFWVWFNRIADYDVLSPVIPIITRSFLKGVSRSRPLQK